jgi:dihydrofolate reductase
MVLALTTKYGLDSQPWNIVEHNEELQRMTRNGLVLMGKKTWLSGHFKGFFSCPVFVLSREPLIDVITFPNLVSAVFELREWNRDVYFVGGFSLFQQALEMKAINHIHLTVIESKIDCECSISSLGKEFTCMHTTPTYSQGDSRYHFEKWERYYP